jgi:ATP-dependent DNA helicase RecG
MLTESELIDLIPKLESDRIERTKSTREDKLGPAICAFANDFPNSKQSGYILLGVEDDGSLAEMKFNDEDLQKIGNVRSNGNISPLPAMIVSPVFKFEKGEVVVIEVLPSFNPPIRFQGKVWIRIGPRRAVANETEERILTEKRASITKTFDAQPCRGSQLEDISLAIIQQSYLPLAIDREILQANHRELKTQLASLRLYDLAFDCPTNASVLGFGLNPLYFLPGAYIQYLKIDSSEIDLDKIRIDKRFQGSLYNVLKEIDSFIKVNVILEKPVRIKGTMQDKVVSNYPLGALREFVMNAIMHRDYESNSPIKIYEFLDRIEIQNAGGLYGSVRPENFPNANDYRNPTIAEMMKLLGYVNKFNFGIADAQKRLADNGNPPPEFKIDVPIQFSVTLKINPQWLEK